MCVLWAVLRVPFGAPMPDYWRDALQLATTGVMQQRFTPSGYPLTVALGMRLTPSHPAYGLVIEQAVLHFVLGLGLWALLRRMGTSARAALVAAVALNADPELVFSIMKVWDVSLSTLMLALAMWMLLRVLERGSQWTDCALLGAVWAFGCFDRPNEGSLLPAIGLALWWGARARRSQDVGVRRLVLGSVLLLVVAGGVYSTCSLLTYRSIRTPGNGPYNLFAGNNPYSKAALLEHLNGEPSIVEALQAEHVDMTGLTPSSAALAPVYTASVRSFARQRPLAVVDLAGVKLFTLLRPDTKLHPLASGPGLVKGVLALFVPCWAVAVLLVRLRWRRLWEQSDTLVAVVAVLYVVPFLITNADPRFRTPLDLLLAAHTVSLLWRRPQAWAVRIT